MLKIAEKPINLLALTPAETQILVQELGWPRYRAQQILRWLYQGRIRTIGEMTNLSLQDRTLLESMATIPRSQSPQVLNSTDGTRKLLFFLGEKERIESVLIPEALRLTLCVSTQVGCTLDCSFCLTGQMGLQRNLKVQEIVDQVLTAQDQLREGERLTSLVFMGMGEPLANWEATSEAITRLTDPNWGVGFSAKRITVSTAGLVPKLHEVGRLGVNLAISLNATTNEQRNRLMPKINSLYPLPDLLEACRTYPLSPGRRLTFEYVLIAGINDSDEDASRLSRHLRGIQCKINLIPFNEIPNSAFRRPQEQVVEHFQAHLRRAGFDVLMRKSRGSDVLGACGQLGEPRA